MEEELQDLFGRTKEEERSETSAPGIYVIEVNLSSSLSWILDTGCGSLICVNVQELEKSRSLMKGEVNLRVRNGARVAALAVGTYVLTLPTGLVLERIGSHNQNELKWKLKFI